MKNKKVQKLIYLVIAIISAVVFKDKVPLNTNTASQSFSSKNYILTKHAKCRMQCRNIDEQDIDDILESGRKNKRKSDPYKKPCPVVALEGYAKKDSQHIRVIAAKCSTKTKIVTVIDLEKKYNCHCD